MNRDEYLRSLATTPATARQVGAIQGHFTRLHVRDRTQRLEFSARLVGLDYLGSTRDLTIGEAGKLVHALEQIDDRDDLAAAAAATAPVLGLLDQLGRFLRAIVRPT